MMQKFRIDYVNPSTGQPASETLQREDIPNMEIRDNDGKLLRTYLYSAKDQVWDFAYILTNKGQFEVKELNQ